MFDELVVDGGPRAVMETRPHEVWPQLAPQTRRAIQNYIEDNRPLSIANGSGIIEEFEGLVRDYFDVSYVLSTNSGTTALHSAYIALDLPPGTEVISPTLTFHASISPALHCGLTPVLVDVQPDTGNVDPQAIRAAISPRTGCVVVNHTWGHPVDLDEIRAICLEFNLKLIEDCSHAYGSRYKGRRVGSFGDIAVFSMQASKMVPAGEGGFLLTNNRLYYERACLAGHYRGRSRRDVLHPELAPYAETGFGLKYRIHPLAAVIAFHEFSLLDERIESRNELLGLLTEGLREIDGIEPPTIRPYVTMGSFYGYKPRYLPGRLQRGGESLSCDEFIRILSLEGLDIHRPSVRPIHLEALFQPGPVPLRSATATWQVRHCGPFTGCAEYFDNRLSLPAFIDRRRLPLVQAYTNAFRKVAYWTKARADG